jgi:hypothetical protein
MKSVIRVTTLAAFAFSATAFAQTPATPPAAPAPPKLVGSIAGHPNWPVAKAEDVNSLEAIIGSVYKAISADKGQQRDWDRFRSLFIPDAALIPTVSSPPAPGPPGHADAILLSVEGYIQRSNGRMTTDGFFEKSIHNEAQQFGNIVQVWSTYESRHSPDDPKPFARGINSFQILKDGDRYWVVNIFWDSETPNKPIPAKFLPQQQQ